jgi:DNA-binding NarL/FixJ family response regulator
MVVFSSAAAALRAATAMQRAVAQSPELAFELRIGVNAGEPIPDDQDYFGSSVVLAKRLCDAAAGGQILVSDVVHQLVGSRGGFQFRSLAPLGLKGFGALVPAWDLVWDEASPAAPAPDQAQLTSVVLIDDEELVREGLKLILDAEPDLRVIGEADNGRRGLELIERLQPDVALMDIQMPVLDGLAATAELSKRGCNTRVVVLTTFDYDENVVRALQAGASAFLLKNAPRAQLATAVRVVTKGDALLDPAVTKRLIGQFVSAARPAGPISQDLQELSPKELEVMRLIARGLSNAEIADELVVSVTTVKSHVAKILMKLGVRDRAQVVVKAYETGLAQPGIDSSPSPELT